MPTPEQQRLYMQLSGQLQAIGLYFYRELPTGAKSLLLKNEGGKVLVEVYDNGGKVIGTVPDERTSTGLRNALQTKFAHIVSPDPDGVVALL